MITIEQTTQTYTPAYNDDAFIVSSDKVAEANFQFVCDVYNGTTFVGRLKTFPNPINNYGFFNPKRILENYVYTDFDFSLSTFQTNEESYIKYNLKFGEEYGLSSSGTTIYPNQVETGFKYSWNGIVDYIDYDSYDQTDYILGANSSLFLTNAPQEQNIGASERAWLYGIANTSGDVYFLEVTTYLAGTNTVIDTYKIANPYQAITTDESHFIRFGVGTYNLNTYSIGTVYSSLNSVFPIIGSNVGYYQVRTLKFDGTATSDVMSYNVTDICTRTEVVRFHFLNKKGGYDSYSFKNKTKRSTAINRSSYKKQLGSYIIAPAFRYNADQRAITTFDTALEDTFTVVSDWINDEHSEWLEELVTSPDVLVEVTTDKGVKLVPVNITDSNYETKVQAISKVFNLTISYQYSFKRYRQRY